MSLKENLQEDMKAAMRAGEKPRLAVIRLINAAISAETLMVLMRHKDFATTKKFYAARRAAQLAAMEIHNKLEADVGLDEFVGR